MKPEYVNKAIECSIENCVNHCCNDDFCSLKKIQVGTHEQDPSQTACTDCKSFQLKQ